MRTISSPKPVLLLTAVLVAVVSPLRAEELPDSVETGHPAIAGPIDDITDAQRREIQERLDQSAAKLTALGLLPAPVPSFLATHATLDWPVRAPTIHDPGIQHLWQFVDHNPAYPNFLLDYNCGNRTYDNDSGYNHQGVDFGIWPFQWLRTDEHRVEVIAAADGIILGKDDGHPDHSCVQDPSLQWNAVYIQHADGSRAWYGHMQNGSLTPKAPGETVARGEYLGLMGSAGNSSVTHLHLEVYDSNGFLNDPYQGGCNNFNATSWWANQRPYYDSGLNRVAAGFQNPVDSPPCPQHETSNEAADFNPGDRAVFIAYYRDQLAGQTAVNTIRRPDGTVFSTWTDNPTAAFFDATWWTHTFATFAAAGPLGTWQYDVTYQGATASRKFRLIAATGSGRVPGEFIDEPPLQINKSGSNLSLTWAASCVPTDTDYEVYEGAIGSWTGHTPALCSTGGSTSATFAPSAGSSYYLVVPADQVGNREGSYGWNREYVERPIGPASCRTQVIGGSCPRCGDNKIESPEVCDRGLLAGHTCQTEGYSDGVLACATDCRNFNTSGCF
jgi:murein DD-endopeptidase MepM/ murein hydrolase activator NlpD